MLQSLALLLALVSPRDVTPGPAQLSPPRTAAVAAVKPPPPPAPKRVDAAKAGVVADGKTDNSAALQRIVDGLPAGGVIDLPPGEIRTRWPVYLDHDNLSLRGAGKGVTTLKADYGQVPPLVAGFRQVEANGQAVTDAHRPDCFGLLDGAYVNRPGLARGFSTQGNAYVTAVAGPPQLGVISPTTGGRQFDGWGAVDGWTLEAALRFRGGVPANCTIAGLGHSQNPGPWWVGTDAESRVTVVFRTAEAGSELGAKPLRVFRGKYPGDGAVHRLRTWVKFAGDGPRVGIAVDGADVPLEATTGVDDFPHFARNLGQYPFFLGPGSGPTVAQQAGGPVPDFDVLAFRVSRVARTAEAPDDKARYAPDWGDPTAVFWSDGASPIGKRHLQFATGISTAIPVTVGFITPTLGTFGGIKNTSISDLSVDGGGVLVGQVLDFRLRDAESANGFVGVASLPLGMNYPVAITDCRLQGWHAGLSLTRAFAWVRNVNVDGSGSASMIFTGCNVRLENSLFSHFSPEAESCVLVLGDEAGGRTSVQNIEVDDEDVWLPSAVKVHLAPYGPLTYVSVRSAGVAQLAPGRPVVDLVGASAWPGVLEASGLAAGPGSVPALVGPGWTATADGAPVAPPRPPAPTDPGR